MNLNTHSPVETINIVPASLTHLDALISLENTCFSSDKLSRRSFKRFITNAQSVFFVVLMADKVVGYLLTIFHRGTRLARLYSMAVSPQYRGRGIARSLMKKVNWQQKKKAHTIIA